MTDSMIFFILVLREL